MNNLNKSKTEHKLVVIGGGSGTSLLLKNLKEVTNKLTAIVTMFDSGGSSGILRDEFGLPPVGDLRQCITSLASSADPYKGFANILKRRFKKNSSLSGHSLGNLVLASLSDSGIESAISQVSSLLNITGEVLPVTLENAHLRTELGNGQILSTESDLDLRHNSNPPVERIFLSKAVSINPRAYRAIVNADAIILGPGDLYTSIIPNLLTDGITAALQSTKAKIIYVCNLMTKKAETNGYLASSFALAISEYMKPVKIDYMFINNKELSQSVLNTYTNEGAHPVKLDIDNPVLKSLVSHLVVKDFVYVGNSAKSVRHDANVVTQTVLDILDGFGTDFR